MRLQPAHHLRQLLVRRRVQRLQIVQRKGVPDPGNDILALRIGQVVAVRAGPPGRRVTGEGNAGAAGLAQVAEHHRADVHRGTQVMRDPLSPPVQPRPVGVPGVEDGLDRHIQLLPRVLRELLTGVLPHRVLERGDQRLQIINIEVDVAGHTLSRLRIVKRIGEHLAGYLQHRLAEHLQQPPVGIPGEALVPGFLGKPLHAGVVKPDVQHRLHHPGHRKRRTGTNTHQQRIMAITEPATEVVLQLPQCHRDLNSQLTGRAALRQVLPASLRRDGEPGRHRQPQLGHLGQVRALTTQQVLLILIALGEVEHVLGHQVSPWDGRTKRSAGAHQYDVQPSWTVHSLARSSLISLVALGPLIQVSGRPSLTDVCSRCTASCTSASSWSSRITQTCRSGTRIRARRRFESLRARFGRAFYLRK